MGCVESRELGAHASPSEVYPARKLQWHFTCGFDFRHSQWLPFVAAFAVLKGLMPDGSKMPYVLKQSCSFLLQVCLSTYDLFLPPGIKGFKFKVNFIGFVEWLQSWPTDPLKFLNHLWTIFQMNCRCQWLGFVLLHVFQNFLLDSENDLVIFAYIKYSNFYSLTILWNQI